LNFYLDASAIMPILIDEPASVGVNAFVRSRDGALVVGEFAAAETASAFSRLVRMGTLLAEGAAARLADFDTWRTAETDTVDLQPSDARLANIFVRRFDLMLRAPDALHAAICRRTGNVLVTLDRRLARAATELGVGVVLPEA
jgi:predicted nucleic acid-binding protein